MDSTFEFEKRRNRPVKYDRNLMGKTIMAMQRVQSIKESREERYHANRMKDAKTVKVAQARVEIEKHAELLAPAAARREEVMQNVLDSARERIATRRVTREKALARGATDGQKMEE